MKLAMVAVALTAWPLVAFAEVPPARQAELLYVLQQDCGSCHGLTLKGGLGTSLLPAELAGRDIQDITDVILDGVPGTPMAPWKALLSEDEARWMADALKQGLAVPK